MKLGLATPAALSSALALATSRLGRGTFFAYHGLLGATHWLPAIASLSITTCTRPWRSSDSSNASRTRGSRSTLVLALSLLPTLMVMPW